MWGCVQKANRLGCEVQSYDSLSCPPWLLCFGLLLDVSEELQHIVFVCLVHTEDFPRVSTFFAEFANSNVFGQGGLEIEFFLHIA